jgi:hypothetical protein
MVGEIGGVCRAGVLNGICGTTPFCRVGSVPLGIFLSLGAGMVSPLGPVMGAVPQQGSSQQPPRSRRNRPRQRSRKLRRCSQQLGSQRGWESQHDELRCPSSRCRSRSQQLLGGHGAGHGGGHGLGHGTQHLTGGQGCGHGCGQGCGHGSQQSLWRRLRSPRQRSRSRWRQLSLQQLVGQQSWPWPELCTATGFAVLSLTSCKAAGAGSAPASQAVVTSR